MYNLAFILLVLLLLSDMPVCLVVLLEYLLIALSCMHIEMEVVENVPTEEPGYEEVIKEYVEEFFEALADFVTNPETAQGNPRCIPLFFKITIVLLH